MQSPPGQPSRLQKSSPSFLDLPLELRQQIYRYYLVREQALVIKKNVVDFDPQGVVMVRNLSLVCKTIKDEALDILYGENCFKLYLTGEDGHLMKTTFGEEQIRRLRNVRLIAWPGGISYRKKLDITFWGHYFLN